ARLRDGALRSPRRAAVRRVPRRDGRRLPRAPRAARRARRAPADLPAGTRAQLPRLERHPLPPAQGGGDRAAPARRPRSLRARLPRRKRETMSARPPGYYENALWLYADATSYAPGETATFFVSSPVRDALTCTLSRVGAREQQVHEQGGIRAAQRDVPEGAYRAGCCWPETFSVRIGADWPSGYYRVQLRAGELAAALFRVVRPANPGA